MLEEEMNIKDKGRMIKGFFLLIVKMSAASGLAWELAKLAGSKHPYLAPLSVILCMQTTILQSVKYSFHRLLGTVLGVSLTIWAADRLSLNGWTLAMLLVAVSGVGLLIERKESVIHEVALSVLLVFAIQKESGRYGLDRIRDTFIGIAVGLAVHMLIYPPNLVKEAESKVSALIKRFEELFLETADWIQFGCKQAKYKTLQTALQTLQNELFQAEKQVEKAAKSLKMNVIARKSKPILSENQHRIALLKQGIFSMERALTVFLEWSSAGKLSQEEQNQWAGKWKAMGAGWSESKKAEEASKLLWNLDLRK